MGKPDKDLQPDGKLHPISDAMEAHPDFSDEFELMSEEFFKEHNPGYYALIKRLKEESGADGNSILEED